MATQRRIGQSTLLAALLLAAGSGDAAVIVGGSALLTAGTATQLETWLGQGPITLTNVYTKQSGDDALDFHAAANGVGPTFVVLDISDPDAAGTTHTGIVGGYNPQSWDSVSGYHTVALPANRTAFLFNLTTGTLFPERTAAFSGGSFCCSDTGFYQTYNNSTDGPTFGGGNDLMVPFNLATGGYSHLWSYETNNAPAVIRSIAGGNFNAFDLTVRGLEVFTVAKSVPEPATLVLVGLGLVCAGLTRARRTH
jgi:hypothetical protein